MSFVTPITEEEYKQLRESNNFNLYFPPEGAATTVMIVGNLMIATDYNKHYMFDFNSKEDTQYTSVADYVYFPNCKITKNLLNSVMYLKERLLNTVLESAISENVIVEVSGTEREFKLESNEFYSYCYEDNYLVLEIARPNIVLKLTGEGFSILNGMPVGSKPKVQGVDIFEKIDEDTIRVKYSKYKLSTIRELMKGVRVNEANL